MTTKEQFLKQKLKNLIIFIAETIGTENKVYNELKDYEDKPIDAFLQMIIALSKYAVKKDNEFAFEEETVVYFLEHRGVQKKTLFKDPTHGEKVLKKLNQYFSMFLNVINN